MCVAVIYCFLSSLQQPHFINEQMGNSLVVQWLGLTAFSARAQGTKILLAVWCGPTSQKKSQWTSLSLCL